MKTIIPMIILLVIVTKIKTEDKLVPASQEIIFIDQGYVYNDVSSYSIVITLDMKLIELDLEEMTKLKDYAEKQLQHKNNIKYYEGRDNLLASIEFFKKEIELLKHRAKVLQDLVSEEKNDKRNRRSAVVAILGLAGMSLANLAYTRSVHNKVSNLEESMQGLAHAINVTASFAEKSVKNIEYLNKTVSQLAQHQMRYELEINNKTMDVERTQRILLLSQTCSQAVTRTQDHINILINIFNQVIQGHLPVELLEPKILKEEMTKIKKKLPKGMVPLIKDNDYLSVYSLPVHTSKQNGTLVAIVNVPIVNPKRLKLYKYIPTPFVMENSLEFVPSGKFQYLLEGEDGTHLEVSNDEIGKCVKFHTAYLCPHLSVLNNNRTITCLKALKLLNLPEALKRCKHTYRLKQEVEVTQLGEGFLIVSTRDTLLKLNCNGRSRTIVAPEGRMMYYPEAGCTIEAGTRSVLAKRPTIFASDQIEAKIMALKLPYQIRIEDIATNIEVDPYELEDFILQLGKVNNIDLKELQVTRAQLQQLNKTRESHVLSIVSAFFCVMGLTLICSFFTWLFYKYSRKDPTPQQTNRLPNPAETTAERETPL